MSLKGYKPYSHEAIISFLKEFYNFKEYDINVFNRYRILRNKSVYGSEKISVGKCKEALYFLCAFLPKIKKEFAKTYDKAYSWKEIIFLEFNFPAKF